MRLAGRRLLLIVSGSVAAYKALELARLVRKEGAAVTGLLTAAGSRFVTPHAMAAITGSRVHGDLWSLEEETHAGHIRLARDHDAIVVAPASADLIAKMALGLADDLATTVLLATTRPVLVAPAMNPTMWAHPATQGHVATLAARGVRFAGPESGAMAEEETGPGRLAEPAAILEAIRSLLAGGPLSGRHALVTSGPTWEPIDPVRFLANRSSGRQGHAIAAALADRGARVTLVSGPVSVPPPSGVTVTRVETAREMLAACTAALPADIAICAAAVADWRPAETATLKLKKGAGTPPPALALAENPDILATLSAPGPLRPALVVGFAAETNDVVAHGEAKRRSKGCDWIVANDVSGDVMGGAENEVHLITEEGVEHWPRLPKEAVAARLADRIAAVFA
ncbi:bifunctional phosphopantothenoylcysteine decarboxylase/phosphopantothenate--cysteine ligase CoaBC [Elioraea tepida]|jgi:phosphopantothenoylcysteine decarboxylase/phosphopantothenate--cysteine ligase|uniref:Coenzyme A biosynthesis bifunctional protein CoaBC n=1 Tax=Elioraea tepida TaxID=2843330 RepID=A0A975U010_9PROT|nr:bifunctional phosphopantothenoylcysteine decarboxylase/phosphopantothenate--cysteine ligase CoaBC [Elioraea tepida]QXM23747.1 bifunctional phosphopantothenoylcysteine decarboxylase/phosphopantothenate--cysteine ligase CoaBC [Elioraea tepida]